MFLGAIHPNSPPIHPQFTPQFTFNSPKIGHPILHPADTARQSTAGRMEPFRAAQGPTTSPPVRKKRLVKLYYFSGCTARKLSCLTRSCGRAISLRGQADRRSRAAGGENVGTGGEGGGQAGPGGSSLASFLSSSPLIRCSSFSPTVALPTWGFP